MAEDVELDNLSSSARQSTSSPLEYQQRPSDSSDTEPPGEPASATAEENEHTADNAANDSPSPPPKLSRNIVLAILSSKIFLGLVTIVSLGVTCLALWPNLTAQTDAQSALTIAKWTAMKDFLEWCEAQTSRHRSKDCIVAIEFGLPAPPNFADATSSKDRRWLLIVKATSTTLQEALDPLWLVIPDLTLLFLAVRLARHVNQKRRVRDATCGGPLSTIGSFNQDVNLRLEREGQVEDFEGNPIISCEDRRSSWPVSLNVREVCEVYTTGVSHTTDGGKWNASVLSTNDKAKEDATVPGTGGGQNGFVPARKGRSFRANKGNRWNILLTPQGPFLSQFERYLESQDIVTRTRVHWQHLRERAAQARNELTLRESAVEQALRDSQSREVQIRITGGEFQKLLEATNAARATVGPLEEECKNIELSLMTAETKLSAKRHALRKILSITSTPKEASGLTDISSLSDGEEQVSVVDLDAPDYDGGFEDDLRRRIEDGLRRRTPNDIHILDDYAPDPKANGNEI